MGLPQDTNHQSKVIENSDSTALKRDETQAKTEIPLIDSTKKITEVGDQSAVTG